MAAQQPLSNRPSPTFYPGPANTAQTAASKTAPMQLVTIGKLWQQVRGTLKGQFIALALCIVAVTLLQAFLLTQAFDRAASDLDAISNGSIPSVDAAQAMAQYIEDIDAKAADYLATAALTDLQPCSIVGTNKPSVKLTVHDCDNLNINVETLLANHELFNAAHNVSYAGERTAVERITAGFEEYTGDIAVMLHEYELIAVKNDPQDAHLLKARQAYQAANNVLLQRITQQPLTNADGTPVFDEPQVPPCVVGEQLQQGQAWPLGSIEDNINCLSSINKDHLDAAYTDTADFLGSSTVLATYACAFLCLLLALATWRMAAITHSVINIGLTLALLVSIVFSVTIVSTLSGFAGQHGAYGQMVKDDYDSVYYAAQLQRYGTAANADESRWLIALEFGDQAEANRWNQDWLTNTEQVRMLIQRAQDNRTWPEEDQPLADMHTNWNTYFTIDGQIRAAASNQANLHRILDAERLSTGQSNQAFGNFVQAVDGLGKANRDHYTITYTSTLGMLQLYVILSTFLFPLIGLAATWGIWRRLKEF